MVEPVISDVSDTAFWIAHYRAQETQRADRLFNDPYASQLAGERGPRIAQAMPGSRLVEWTVALRTHIIDDFILDAVTSGTDVILNLGAGLDARPYRLNLPADLRWIEADYARIIEYKEQILSSAAPRCRLERIKIDLAQRPVRQRLLQEVDASAKRCLVITEGVVPYLTNADAGLLADDLRSMVHAHGWILDYFSPDAQRYRRSARREKVMANARFQFEPKDWFGFFREHGWQPKALRFFVEESVKLQRPLPLPFLTMLRWMLKAPFIPRARREQLSRSAGYALMERID